MAYERAGVVLPGWGNANTWADYARNAGYSVGTTPRANSIAVWTNCGGICATYGHVGYVERVSADGSILYIKDSSQGGMNGCPDTEDPTYKECMANGVSEASDRECYNNAPKVTCGFKLAEQGITAYIYLDDAPKNPVYVAPAPVEVKKSSNNNLKELTIDNIEFEFKKDTLEYNLEVEYEIEEIEISATKEDSKATIEGTGKQSLEVGDNTYKIKITAEDKSTKEYIINITRKEEPIVEEETTEIKEISTPKKENKTIDKKIIIIGIGTILVIVVLSISIVLMNNKKALKK